MPPESYLLSETELIKQIQSVDLSLLSKTTLLVIRGAITHNTTKFCPKCLDSNLLELRSQNKKICTRCNIEIPWFLDKGQKGL